MRFWVFFLSFVFLFHISVIEKQAAEQSSIERSSAWEIAASLSDEILAAQVLLTGIDGRASLTPAMRSLLQRVPAGGVMLFGFNLNTSKADVKNLLSETCALIKANAGLRPFIAVDHEGGRVHRFGPGVERPPSAFSFWELVQREGHDAALTLAETIYSRSALEIRALGVNMVLAPVAEILDDDNVVFLGARSYGPDPDFTEAAASVFVKSMETAGIASVVKHFPGHTAIDPHYGISSLMHDRAALGEKVQPFAGIIRRLRPPSIMISHVMVPAMDSQNVASLSRIVIEDWLRGELGFQGIVMADDFAMGAVTALGISTTAATVQALNAGVDMIMVWPRDLAATHAVILRALRDGQLSRERLVEAAARIIAEKQRFGLLD